VLVTRGTTMKQRKRQRRERASSKVAARRILGEARPKDPARATHLTKHLDAAKQLKGRGKPEK